jgi:cell wall-associated NlpC family hydrolase
VSLADVTARMAAIQAQIATGPALPAAVVRRVPAPVVAGAVAPSADFATTLGVAQAELGAPTGATGPVTSGGTGADLAAAASGYVGVPYVAGGRSPSTGWDCAGFTQFVARSVGIDLPAVSWEQIKAGTAVPSLADARPGDLVFFHEPGGHQRDPSPLKVNHVAVYLGDGRVVEAASPAAGTRIAPVDVAHLVGIRRVAPTTAPVSGVSALAASDRSAFAGTASATGVDPAARPLGPALAPSQLVDLLRSVGFTGDGLRTAWAVAMRESGGRPDALGAVNANGTRDHGLFQINDIHLGSLIDATRVDDPVANARAAFTLSNGGTDWSAWGLGSTGYARHLAQTAPDVLGRLTARFQSWYDRFPAG